MGNGMNKILPNLFLGNLHDAKDQQQLNNNKITHIVSAFDSAKPFLKDKKYLCLLISDTPTESIEKYFVSTAHYIHQARLKKEALLVHCLAGVSRSTSLVIAYLMLVSGLGFRECYAIVKHCRSCANPNFGFQKQLVNFQYSHLFEERKKFMEQYSDSMEIIEEDKIILENILKEVKEEERKESLKNEEKNKNDTENNPGGEDK